MFRTQKFSNPLSERKLPQRKTEENQRFYRPSDPLPRAMVALVEDLAIYSLR